MVTDEEVKIIEEVEKLLTTHNESSLSLYMLFQEAIKKGIQMERQRLRKQVKKTSEDQQCLDILIDDIDIWDDIK